MSLAEELLSIKNSKIAHDFSPLKRAPFHPPSSLKFDSALRPRAYRCRVGIEPPTPRGLALGIGTGLTSINRRNSWDRSLAAFAASPEESKHSEIEVEMVKDDNEMGADESQEAWKQTLDSFKEQALKMQSVSQEAYEVYSKKAMIIFKETSEKLKVQADKARNDLTGLAKELSEESKEYLSTAAENSPEPVREVVEILASSTDDLNEISKVRDFSLGVPYGLLLSVGGFLSFMLTGSISAIRFGVILGGALLALSVSSLRSYKRGEPYSLALKGQAAIAALIFLREIRILSQRASFFAFLTTIISGAMVVFYIYRMTLNGKQTQGPDLGHGAEN